MSKAFFAAASLGACLFAGAAEPLRSVDQLPVDRFDEYPEGAFPSHPWIRLGKEADGLSLVLRRDAESPFCANKVTGKALVLTDASPSAGHGAGASCEFTAPPDGDVYLGFDFKYDSGPQGKGLDFVALLSKDGSGGLELHLGEGGALTTIDASGKPLNLAALGSGKWYHIGATVSPDGSCSVKLFDFSKKRDKGNTLAPFKIKHPGLFKTLDFFSSGPDERQGSWTLDNVCMAGKVDAPRQAWWPFEQAPLSELRSSQKKVFAYYFPVYGLPSSLEDPGLSWTVRTVNNPSGNYGQRPRPDSGTEFLYIPYPRTPQLDEKLDGEAIRQLAADEQIRLYRNQGLDGLLVDFFAKPDPKTGPLFFIKSSYALLDAAQRVDPGFKIIPAVYSWGEKSGVNGEGDAEVPPLEYANSPEVKRVLAHPSVLRLPDGRAVFSMWLTEKHSASWWREVMDELARNGTPIALLPQFNSYGKLKDFAPVSFGMAHWGPRSPGHFKWAESVKPLGCKVVMPIVEQDARPRNCMLWECEGSSTLRSLWKDAIDGADWAFIYSLNDYTEQAQAPSTCIGFVPYDLNAYYVQWFKTGVQPKIVRDVLYYFYRKGHSSIEPSIGKKWSFNKQWGLGKSNVKDEVELLAFLSKPGKLKMEIAGKVKEMDAPEGITSFKAPFESGIDFVPRFVLERGGAPVIEAEGQFAVPAKAEYQNPLYCSGVAIGR